MRPIWEEKWQRLWEKHRAYRVVDPTGPKTDHVKYALEMFPYTSAEGLHVGHPEGYTASDIYSRYLRMNGKSVLHPMGFDSFGLPAENYAIKTGTHPAITTKKNIDNMRRQIKSFGFSYDWDREVITSDPSYYKWTQWIFLKLFEAGLAYEAEAPINWCPKDKTGLANEEVVGGKCERCGTQVEKKNIRQWLVKITDERYIERLLHGHDNLNWPESLKLLQRNWIGRSEGAEVDFAIDAHLPKKVVIVHGYQGDPDTGWKAWIIPLLKKAGIEVHAPRMIGGANPDLTTHVKILDGIGIDADTVLVGHSLGCTTVLEYVQKKKVRVGHVVLVAPPLPAVRLKSASAYPEGVRGYSSWKFDFPLIKRLASRITIIADLKDDKVTLPEPAHFTEKLSAELIKEVAPRRHFSNRGLDPYASWTILNAIAPGYGQSIRVFTTRPDTLFGATYMVLSPEHPLVVSLSTDKQKKEVLKYQTDAKKKSDLERTDLAKEKTGVFTGSYAINPVNGEKIPIWIADYVLATYGTGAIMAVPAHDERDFAFAKKFKLKIVDVIDAKEKKKGEVFTGNGTAINSGTFNGLSTGDFKKKIIGWLEKEGKGKKAVNYKLRDWVFSRQRYWGEPIPIVHCEQCKKDVESTPHYLSFRHQPIWDRLMSGEKKVESRVLNPEEPERYFGKIRKGSVIKCINRITSEVAFFRVTEKWEFKNAKELFKHQGIVQMIKGKKVASVKELLATYETHAPGYAEKLEKNGLIAWKFQRVFPGLNPVEEKDLPVVLPDIKKYEPTGTGESPLASVKDWVNTTCPKCGGPAKRETNTMPQWAGSNWYFLRYCDPHNKKQLADPKKLAAWLPVDVYTGGAEHAVLHFLYARFVYKFLYDTGVVPKSCGEEPFIRVKNQGLIMGEDGQKMSKSRGNVINPDEIVNEFGADVVRMYEMFMGPLEAAKPWNTKGMIGIKRFLDRVYSAQKNVKDIPVVEGKKLLHTFIKYFGEDIEKFKFNTCVSTFMEWSNHWGDKPIPLEEYKTFIILLSPFAPHFSEELWQKLHNRTEKDFSLEHSIVTQMWPKFDQTIINQKISFTLVVMINGKKRDDFQMPANTDESTIKQTVHAREKVQTWTKGKKILKEMYIKGKIYSIVVKESA